MRHYSCSEPAISASVRSTVSVSLCTGTNYAPPPSLPPSLPEVFTRSGLGGEYTGGAPGEAVAEVGSGARAGAVGLVSLRQHVPAHRHIIMMIIIMIKKDNDKT